MSFFPRDTCAKVGGGLWQWGVGVRGQHHLRSFLFGGAQCSLSLTLGLTNSAKLADQQASCLHLLGTGMAGVCHEAQLFQRDVGIRTRVLILAQRELYCLSHLSGLHTRNVRKPRQTD